MDLKIRYDPLEDFLTSRGFSTTSHCCFTKSFCPFPGDQQPNITAERSIVAIEAVDTQVVDILQVSPPPILPQPASPGKDSEQQRIFFQNKGQPALSETMILGEEKHSPAANAPPKDPNPNDEVFTPSEGEEQKAGELGKVLYQFIVVIGCGCYS